MYDLEKYNPEKGLRAFFFFWGGGVSITHLSFFTIIYVVRKIDFINENHGDFYQYENHGEHALYVRI